MTVSRHAGAVVLWPFGIALTSWHYIWRTTPLHRREHPGSWPEDGPPPLPPDVDAEGIQLPEDGVGPLLRRRYRVRVHEADLSPDELMAVLREDLNRAAPTEFARFTKVRGEGATMQPGDEYVVRMPGPWNGPVRVVAVSPASYRVATLDGHFEAGQVEVRAEGDGVIEVTVESWARSGDRLSKLLHQHLHMAKEVQLHMWTSFLERMVRLAGGRMKGGIDVDTRRVDLDGDGDGS